MLKKYGISSPKVKDNKDINFTNKANTVLSALPASAKDGTFADLGDDADSEYEAPVLSDDEPQTPIAQKRKSGKAPASSVKRRKVTVAAADD